MRDLFFIFNGIDSRELGIQLQKPVQISGPEPEVEVCHVPGRSEDLVYYTGAYKHRKGTARCYVAGDRVQEIMAAANDRLLASPGYHRLQVSQDPGHYFMARIVQGGEIDDRMGALNAFSIRFDISPKQYKIE